MLRIEGVHTFYGAIEALKGVDLHVEEVEIVAMIGASLRSFMRSATNNSV